MSPYVKAALITNLTNAGLGILNNYQNQQLAVKQNRWNNQMWRQQNAYNAPSNQIARLSSAGINPALAYSNGSVPNSSSSLPEMVSSRNMPVQFDPLSMAQAKLLEAQANATNDSNKRENEKQGYYLQSMAAEIAKLNADTGLANSQTMLNGVLEGKAKQETANLYQQWEQSNQKFEQELSILKSDAEIRQEEARRIADTLQSSIDQATALAKFYEEQTKAIPAELAIKRYHNYTERMQTTAYAGYTYNMSAVAWGNFQQGVVKQVEELNVLRAEVEKIQADIAHSNAETQTENATRLQKVIQGYVNIIKTFADMKANATNANAHLIQSVTPMLR